jgi:hypothetical protein
MHTGCTPEVHRKIRCASGVHGVGAAIAGWRRLATAGVTGWRGFSVWLRWGGGYQQTAGALPGEPFWHTQPRPEPINFGDSCGLILPEAGTGLVPVSCVSRTCLVRGGSSLLPSRADFLVFPTLGPRWTISVHYSSRRDCAILAHVQGLYSPGASSGLFTPSPGRFMTCV